MSDSLDILKDGLKQDKQNNTNSFLILVLFIIVSSIWLSHFTLASYIEENKKANEKQDERIREISDKVIRNSTLIEERFKNEKHNTNKP